LLYGEVRSPGDAEGGGRSGGCAPSLFLLYYLGIGRDTGGGRGGEDEDDHDYYHYYYGWHYHHYC